jgi:hypothetical protein
MVCVPIRLSRVVARLQVIRTRTTAERITRAGAGSRRFRFRIRINAASAVLRISGRQRPVLVARCRLTRVRRALVNLRQGGPLRRTGIWVLVLLTPVGTRSQYLGFPAGVIIARTGAWRRFKRVGAPSLRRSRGRGTCTSRAGLKSRPRALRARRRVRSPARSVRFRRIVVPLGRTAVR